MVFGTTDADESARRHGPVDEGRAATPALILQDGDLQARGIAAFAAQRVLAHVVDDIDVDVRARRPTGQWPAVRLLQRQPRHANRFPGYIGDTHLTRDSVLRGGADAERGVSLQDIWIATLWIPARVPAHIQVVRAAERGVRQEGESLVRNQLHVRQPLGELLQEDAHLHASEFLPMH